jgi:hypothetical protein
MQLTGEIGALKVAGVLNLSGTLWRSTPGQRISTVRYEELDGRLLSLVDFDVTSERLIHEGRLRPVDLYRQKATVELADLTDATRIVGRITDLDEGPARAALRGLAQTTDWREKFVEAVLYHLKRAYEDLDRKAPVKGLIVAVNQNQARALQHTANAFMQKNRLADHFTALAISDDPQSAQILKRFKAQQTPGLLCTCDQAGEGYNCPDIIVIGYASNKLTPLYIRQVVARAQRVTDWEREKYGRPLPAAIVLPDVPALIEHMRNILQPMRHELVEQPMPPERPEIPGQPPAPRYLVTDVREIGEGLAHVTGVPDGEVGMEDVRGIEPHLRTAGLATMTAARALWAMRQWIQTRRDMNPFDALSPEEQQFAAGPSIPSVEAVQREPLAQSEQAARWQAELAGLERWWSQHGPTPVMEFAAAANRLAGIRPGQRDRATLAMIQVAYRWAQQQIVAHCDGTGQPWPIALRRLDHAE